MKDHFRVISMAVVGFGLLALGVVVALAAGSPPGRQEPVLAMTWGSGLDVSGVLTWVVLAAAAIGAVILLTTSGKRRPRGERKSSRLLVGLLIGIAVFALVARLARLSSGLGDEPSEIEGGLTETPEAIATTGNAWVLGVLVAGLLVITLVRASLGSTRRSEPIVEPGSEPVVAVVTPATVPAMSGARDPTSRVLDAYLRFELAAGAAGVTREPAETAVQHARRAADDLRLPRDEVAPLMAAHSRARFGSDRPSPDEAETAESMSASLCRMMPS